MSPQTIEESRNKLMTALSRAKSITFVRAYGNLGDELIYAGTRHLLKSLPYTEISLRSLQGVAGDTALLAGSGGWCRAYHGMPKYLPLLERRFQRVIILPSSFDPDVPLVHEALTQTRAKVFAREHDSFERIRSFCDADLAHDCAFYFDYAPYQQPGSGVLIAFREDKETVGRPVPKGNRDISLTCSSLDEWLRTIARHAKVITDRAHVMIAAALLGKEVDYLSSNYHKVPALAKFSLTGFPVRQVEHPRPTAKSINATKTIRARTKDDSEWRTRLRETASGIDEVIRPYRKCIFIDEEQVRPFLQNPGQAIPFLERDGVYWGLPEDSPSAIEEMDYHRKHGAEVVVVTWPAFWWLEYFKDFAAHLERVGRQIARTDRWLIYELGSRNLATPSER